MTQKQKCSFRLEIWHQNYGNSCRHSLKLDRISIWVTSLRNGLTLKMCYQWGLFIPPGHAAACCSSMFGSRKKKKKRSNLEIFLFNKLPLNNWSDSFKWLVPFIYSLLHWKIFSEQLPQFRHCSKCWIYNSLFPNTVSILALEATMVHDKVNVQIYLLNNMNSN